MGLQIIDWSGFQTVKSSLHWWIFSWFFLVLVPFIVNVQQTSENNSTWSRYLKKPWYSAIIGGRIVGQIVVQYSTKLNSKASK